MSHFITYSAEDYEYLLTPLGYVALILCLAIVFFIGLLFISKQPSKKITTKQLTFSGIAMSLAIVTSYIKFASLPFGGSITLFSMFFICLIGYLYGLKAGLVTGVAYGILQLITGPYIYAPLQVLFDYPLAFGALGLSGIFSKSKFGLLKGYLLGVFMRYAFHVVSGYIFFAEYAPKGTNPMIYTLGYNATYIVPEAIITCILILMPPFVKAINQLRIMANEA